MVLSVAVATTGLAAAQTPADSVPDAPAAAPAPPCVPADSSKPATAGAKPCVTPSVSKQFPFPGEAPETPAADPAKSGSVKDKFPYPGETAEPKSAAPKPGSAGDKFPYPGETKESPDAAPETPDFAPDPDAPPRKPKGESGSSSSGSSSSSSDDDAAPGDNPAAKDDDDKPGLKDEGTTGSTARHRRILGAHIPAQKVMSDEDRVAEDLSIAHFYTQSGNLAGAYIRTKDAVKLEPDDPDAHLALADVAEKMGKKDEAVSEYGAFLKLDPANDKAKVAKKALDRLLK